MISFCKTYNNTQCNSKLKLRDLKFLFYSGHFSNKYQQNGENRISSVVAQHTQWLSLNDLFQVYHVLFDWKKKKYIHSLKRKDVELPPFCRRFISQACHNYRRNLSEKKRNEISEWSLQIWIFSGNKRSFQIVAPSPKVPET